MDVEVSDVYIDNLIESTIDIDPEAMFQVLEWMQSLPACHANKEVKRMNKTINEQYVDGLIDNSIDIDPAAMSLVLQWMESIRQSNDVNEEIEHMGKTINEVYMDNMIETAIGADPVAMYQLLNKMDSLAGKPERDRAFSAYIDELAGGIDDQLKDYLADLSFAGSDIMKPSDLNSKSDMDINSNTINKLNRMEERLVRIERSLEKLGKENNVKFKAVI